MMRALYGGVSGGSWERTHDNKWVMAEEPLHDNIIPGMLWSSFPANCTHGKWRGKLWYACIEML